MVPVTLKTHPTLRGEARGRKALLQALKASADASKPEDKVEILSQSLTQLTQGLGDDRQTGISEALLDAAGWMDQELEVPFLELVVDEMTKVEAHQPIYTSVLTRIHESDLNDEVVARGSSHLLEALISADVPGRELEWRSLPARNREDVYWTSQYIDNLVRSEGYGEARVESAGALEKFQVATGFRAMAAQKTAEAAVQGALQAGSSDITLEFGQDTLLLGDHWLRRFD